MQNDLLGGIAVALATALPDFEVRGPKFGVVQAIDNGDRTVAEVSVVDIIIHAALYYKVTVTLGRDADWPRTSTQRRASIRKEYDARNPSSLEMLITDITNMPESHDE